MATVAVKRYKRKSTKGRRHSVKSYKRKKRALGKKITYKAVGIFKVGHDEKGNFRGSKITPLEPLKLKKVGTKKARLKIRRAKKYNSSLFS